MPILSCAALLGASKWPSLGRSARDRPILIQRLGYPIPFTVRANNFVLNDASGQNSAISANEHSNGTAKDHMGFLVAVA